MRPGMREINFGTVYWGTAYRHYFLDYCLPSLLAEGNLPALSRGGHRFLICTGDEDWTATKSHPAFLRLEEHMRCERLDFDPPANDESTMRAMSRGHKALAALMFDRRVFGSFVYPDTIYADGAIGEIGRLAAAKWAVVLALCPRFATTELLAEIDSLRGDDGVAGTPLTLSPRRAVDLALGHMHAETQGNEWTAPCFGPKATMAFWRIADGSGLLFHSLHWAPVLLDYATLDKHDARTLDDWTIDADYVFRNFPDVDKVHVIDDSDRATLVSFSPDTQPSPKSRIQGLPVLGDLFRTLLFRKHLNSPRFDALKRALVARPVRVHRHDVGPAWKNAESEAARCIAGARSPMTAVAHRLLQVLTIADEGIPRHARLWLRRRWPPRA